MAYGFEVARLGDNTLEVVTPGDISAIGWASFVVAVSPSLTLQGLQGYNKPPPDAPKNVYREEVPRDEDARDSPRTCIGTYVGEGWSDYHLYLPDDDRRGANLSSRGVIYVPDWGRPYLVSLERVIPTGKSAALFEELAAASREPIPFGIEEVRRNARIDINCTQTTTARRFGLQNYISGLPERTVWGILDGSPEKAEEATEARCLDDLGDEFRDTISESDRAGAIIRRMEERYAAYL